MTAARKIHQFFGFAETLRCLGVKLVAQDGIRIADIDIVVVKHDPERLVEPTQKSFTLLCSPAMLRIAQNVNRSAMGVGKKNIAAVWCHRQPPGLLEVRRENVYLK